MSERGSFATQYMYCRDCFAGVRRVLSEDRSGCLSLVTAIGEHLIIAGKIGGSYRGEEYSFFDFEIRYRIEEAICHHVRISVLPDFGESDLNDPIWNGKERGWILTFEPHGSTHAGSQTSAGRARAASVLMATPIEPEDSRATPPRSAL